MKRKKTNPKSVNNILKPDGLIQGHGDKAAPLSLAE